MNNTPTPTSQQQDFITELTTGTSSIALEAVAGSGKTTTLVQAASALPVHKSVLALAFNAKIKTELENKLPSHIICKTLNALGHQALTRSFGRKLKLDARKIGKITSDIVASHNLKDEWQLFKDWVAKAKAEGVSPPGLATGLLPDNIATWRDIASKYNLEVIPTAPDRTLEPVAAQAWRTKAEKQLQRYVAIAREILTESYNQALQGKIDFDDQLYMILINQIPLDKYAIVLVDEAQDLSLIQHYMIRQSLRANGRLIAVGDTHQAIYGFRGADADSLSRLKKEFNMKVLPLTCSFRCAKSIITKAEEIVPHITAHASAPEGSVTHLSEWDIPDITPGSIILCRNIFPLVMISFRSIKLGIPCYMLGRNLGGGLIATAKKLSGDTAVQLLTSLSNWKTLQIHNATQRNDYDTSALIMDMAETLECIIIHSKSNSPAELQSNIKLLFSPDSGRFALSTIHRSKGLEWDTVYFLDSYRIPSKYAVLDWQIQQELNLKYICITRAKQNLIYIDRDGLNKGENDGTE